MHPDYEILDERFLMLTQPNVRLEKLHGGMRWAEGPVYFIDSDTLLWSDIPNNRIMQWADGLGARIWRQDSRNSNGNTRDRQGRLITCEHGARRVTRTEIDGSITILADRFEGKRLNSPNDAVVKSDHSIWFTDPPYGILSAYEGERTESEIGACNVYRLDPANGALSIVAGDFDKPNGIAFSPDESKLCIADTGISHRSDGAHHIRVFDVVDGTRLANGRVLADITPGCADGFRIDTDGNIWTSAGDGVHCLTPEGMLLGKIKVPEVVANLCFGGPKRNRLFITATTSLYSIFVAASGVSWP